MHKLSRFITLRNYLAFLLALAFSISALQACAVTGYKNVDTTRKAMLVANAEIRAANLLLQDLVVRNVISDDDARSALQSLREAHGALTTAHSALTVADDPATAQTGLERANRALTLALTLLANYTGEP